MKKGVVGVTLERACKMKCSTLTKLITEKSKSCFKESWRQELFNDSRNCLMTAERGTLDINYDALELLKITLGWNHIYTNVTQLIGKLSRLRLSCHRLQVETGRYNTQFATIDRKTIDRTVQLIQ